VSLFVDTSAWFAAADRGDAGNERAKAVLASGEPLLTTDHVLLETWSLIRDRLGSDAAGRFWDGLRAGAARIEMVTAADLEAAWAIGEAFREQEFSIVERTSFAVMERLGLRRAATFADGFAIYRFGPKRDRAFEIVR
jgi:uncharacterized protein